MSNKITLPKPVTKAASLENALAEFGYGALEEVPNGEEGKAAVKAKFVEVRHQWLMFIAITHIYDIGNVTSTSTSVIRQKYTAASGKHVRAVPLYLRI